MARLLVLWLLAEGPSYGYQIKRALTDHGMGFWFGLEDASIYSVLRTLTKHGYAREVGVERERRRPQRTRYAITAAGRRHYETLLMDAIRQVRLPVGPLDVALAAGGDLEPSRAGEAVAARMKALHQLEADLESHRSAAPHPAIADRNLALIRAERTWLASLDPAAIT